MSETESLPPIELNQPGRMISPSKSKYFFVKSRGLIWCGDLDVTRDTPRLQEIAQSLGEDIFILRERDCPPKASKIVLDNAIATIPVQ